MSSDVIIALLFIVLLAPLFAFVLLTAKYEDMRLKFRMACALGEEPNFTRFEWWLWSRL